MSIDKLKTVYSTGAFVNNVKTFFKKINEIIDYLNDNPIPAPTPALDYKIYRAIISQTATNDPIVVTELENTLGTVTYNYINSSGGEVLSSGLFTQDKTFFYISNYSDAGANDVALKYYDINTLELAWTGNGSLNKTPIEIIVYN